MQNTYQAHGNGMSLIIVEEPRGVMFEFRASGMADMREMWTHGERAADVLRYIRNMLPVEIDLTAGRIHDITE